MLNSYDENRKMIFAARLKSLIKKWEQANGEQLPQGKLAESLGYTRESVNGWINGKRVPDDRTINELCKFFSVPLNYFSANAADEILISEEQHKKLAEESAFYAKNFGVSEAFLAFLKENKSLADPIISSSFVDLSKNSLNTNVPDSGSPFQFVSSSGVKIYLSFDSLRMLSEVQNDLIDYARYLIEKYSKKMILEQSHEPLKIKFDDASDDSFKMFETYNDRISDAPGLIRAVFGAACCANKQSGVPIDEVTTNFIRALSEIEIKKNQFFSVEVNSADGSVRILTSEKLRKHQAEITNG